MNDITKVIIELRDKDGDVRFMASAPSIDLAIEKLGAIERGYIEIARKEELAAAYGDF